MSEQKMYHAPDLDVQLLTQALSQWFHNQGFEAQTLQTPAGGWVVQARKAETWRSLVGMSAALNVTMNRQEDKILVEIGAAQWTDKAVVGAVGALVFWPALIPAAFGAWKQQKLPAQVFAFIDQYVALGGKVTEADLAHIAQHFEAGAATPEEEALCPSCGKPVRHGAKFCDNCGANMAPTCAKCGATLRAGAKFCDGCGAPVEPK